jgi:hypothetical protein
MNELTTILKEVRELRELLEDLKQQLTKENRIQFQPPSNEEVAEYFLERMPSAETEDALNFADIFISHYTNTNWYYGKKKMKDWKAAMRSAWKLNEFITKKINNNDKLGRIQRTQLQEWIDSE